MKLIEFSLRGGYSVYFLTAAGVRYESRRMNFCRRMKVDTGSNTADIKVTKLYK